MKVAFVGASGYGNVGDNCYPILWRRYFPRLETRFYNSDLPADGLDDDTALVVFGGGGLMWYKEGNAHFEYMTYYIAEAERLGIPFGFISSDFQFDHGKNDVDVFDTEDALKAWVPELRKADFIQLRSKNSVTMLAEHGIEASYAPDFAYLFRPSDMLKKPELITVIPAAQVQNWNKNIAHDIESAQQEWPDARLIFLNMGGPGTDQEAQQFSDEYPSSIAILSEQADPTRTLDIIGRSHIVLTGRYHGMIFSRNCDTPYRVYPRAQYKISVEPPPEETGNPWQNVITLSRVLRELDT